MAVKFSRLFFWKRGLCCAQPSMADEEHAAKRARVGNPDPETPLNIIIILPTEKAFLVKVHPSLGSVIADAHRIWKPFICMSDDPRIAEFAGSVMRRDFGPETDISHLITLVRVALDYFVCKMDPCRCDRAGLAIYEAVSACISRALDKAVQGLAGVPHMTHFVSLISEIQRAASGPFLDECDLPHHSGDAFRYHLALIEVRQGMMECTVFSAFTEDGVECTMHAPIHASFAQQPGAIRAYMFDLLKLHKLESNSSGGPLSEEYKKLLEATKKFSQEHIVESFSEQKHLVEKCVKNANHLVYCVARMFKTVEINQAYKCRPLSE